MKNTKKSVMLLALALSAVCFASCAKGGNADKGRNGNIGTHRDHEITENHDKNDSARDRRIRDGHDMTEYDGIMPDRDIEEIPSEIRDGINDLMPNVGSQIRR